jgi:phosphate transport system permease protein
MTQDRRHATVSRQLPTDARSASEVVPSAERGRFALRDRLAACGVWSAAAVIVTALTWILFDVLQRGRNGLSLKFLITEPIDAGRAGGIGPMVVSTLLILGVTLIVAAPTSLATGVALAERSRDNGVFGRLVRRSLDLLAAVPSIVFGLFGNALFCVTLGLGYSILSGGLTLACMILPLTIRSTEQALRAVPDEYRLAAAALGLPRTATLRCIELPVAARGLAGGLILGIGRALAETAALIFTAGYVTRWPSSLNDSGRALSVHVYDLAMNIPGGNSQAYATAAVLVIVLLILNAISNRFASLVGGRVAGTAQTGIVR